MSGKTEWPELVGKPFEEVKAAILNDNGSLQVQSVPEGSMVTMDWREDRVRVFVDNVGNCAEAPRIG